MQIQILLFVVAFTVCADQIPLHLKERAGVQRQGDYATFGIPLPFKAGIRDVSTLGIFSPEGSAINAQFKITGRWGGAENDNSKNARWLLMTFPADIAANGEAGYELKTYQSTSALSGITINETPSLITVNTGEAVFVINKDRYNVFESVTVSGTQIVSAGSSAGAIITDSSYEYSGRNSPVRFSIEDGGPLMAVVKASGAHRANSGAAHTDFTCRYYFYYGKSYVRLFYRIENNRQDQAMEAQPDLRNLGCSNSVDFEDMSISVRLNGSPPYAYIAGGQDAQSQGVVNTRASLYQESSGRQFWDSHTGITSSYPLRPSAYVTFKGYRIGNNGSVQAQGDTAAGWMAVSSGSRGIMAGCRDFSELYPKALRADSTGAIQIALFPGEFPRSFNFRPGEYKTHETYFYFYTGVKTPSELNTVAKALNRPLMGRAETSWYIQSKAIQDFHEYKRGASDAFDTLYERAIYAALDSNIGHEVWEDLQPVRSMYQSIEENNLFGWMDFGDLPVDYESGRGQLGMKYNSGYGFLIQFFRTGDYAWWELGENGERHEGDMDIIHTGRDSATHPYWDGSYQGHSNHDEPGDRNPHRNYGGGNPDLCFGAPGLFLYYYLTGYEWAYEYAVEISDCILRKSLDNPDPTALRAAANKIRILYEAWRATGEAKYGERIEPIINYILDQVPGFSSAAGFSSGEILRNLGLYIDYKEIITGEAQTELRNLLIRKADTLRTFYTLYDDSLDYATIQQTASWNRLFSDVYGYVYKYTKDQEVLDFALRVLHYGLFEQTIGVGCNPVTWGPNLLQGPQDHCGIIDYVYTKETINAVKDGLITMAQKYPEEEYAPNTIEGTGDAAGGSGLLVHSYPNPFNPVARIIVNGKEAAGRAKVKIRIFDIHGKLIYEVPVASHAAGCRPADIVWDAAAMPSGVYVLKAIAGDRMVTRKLMLVK